MNETEKTKESYGMIHSDYNDGNYCIDYETGDITVFDFDEACYSWYMLDLAQHWTNGHGWAFSEPDAGKRKQIMDDYFGTVLEGYRSETDISNEMLETLPLFLKIFAMEIIVWEFENMQNGVECDEELSYHLKCMEDDIPYWGFFHDVYSCERPFEYEARDI